MRYRTVWFQHESEWTGEPSRATAKSYSNSRTIWIRLKEWRINQHLSYCYCL